MTKSILCAGAAASALMLALSIPQPVSAAPGVAFDAATARPAMAQEVGYKYRRRYYRDPGSYVRAPFTEVDSRRGTWVAAPFVRVYSDRHGTWVRAPFVNRWVPR